MTLRRMSLESIPRYDSPNKVTWISIFGVETILSQILVGG